MDSRRFFLLGRPCPASEIPSMMGRVVAYKLQPLEKYAPFCLQCSTKVDRHNPEDIIPNILPKPSLSISRKDVLSATTDHGLRLSLGSLFGIEFGREKENSVELETACIKTYALSNPDAIFDMLMQNNKYAADVQKLCASITKRQAFLVTGFLTTSGATWTRRHGEKRTGGFTAAIPVSAAVAGLPIPAELIDPAIEPSRMVGGSIQKTMKVEEEQIFAMSYSLVKITYHLTKKKTQPGTPRIGPPVLAKLRDLAFGETEEEDIPAEARGDVFLVDIEDESEDDSEDDDSDCWGDEGAKKPVADEKEANAPYFALHL
ncbi:hypothetical protein DL766_005195 [Monosporascus sp. MC13-8B]|uniref:Uncharacterized protein n=1 Tax=Monosporascus cannonballus TaxID=155416 RepID=A0ABY0HAN3_9PEZI|nr:hypothetical protein DL762_003571 [Monosporascus cannonballus]RYO98176.1 hypothetical protein DL763_002417 [Monosporascus cannonballus]RYP29830.1 hypothetical protein DL766_005195 [Monosporascus sp. MC13-8B]